MQFIDNLLGNFLKSKNLLQITKQIHLNAIVEMFKVKTEQSLKIMNNIFKFRKNNYDLISKSHVKRVNMRTAEYKAGSLRCGIAKL